MLKDLTGVIQRISKKFKREKDQSAEEKRADVSKVQVKQIIKRLCAKSR